MPAILDESNDMDGFMLFPITDLDGDYSGDEADDENENGDLALLKNGHKPESPARPAAFRPLMTLKQRRRSLLGGSTINNLNLHWQDGNQNTLTPLIQSPPPAVIQSIGSPRDNWKKAFRLVRQLKDPWAAFHIEELPVEVCTRHRYHALKKKWVVDQVLVKMQNEPFNHGAMRACFRLKKQSSFSLSHNWKHAQNYVAKSYMEDVNRDVYMEDVRLQMDAKLWGEEYNRHNPPKKADIFQMSVIEFTNRPGQPLYHLEHFIEGHYIKYNSNSGFVEEDLRLTPQAFSHFTFERSGHRLIVVDIQGVGDLWTDPQIHTSNGEGYGDGNLGTRGMALFFHSHACNAICRGLGLSKFDLASTERSEQLKYIRMQRDAKTVARGTEAMCISASPADCHDLTAFLSRARTISTASAISEMSEYSDDEDEDDQCLRSTDDEPFSPLRRRPSSSSSEQHQMMVVGSPLDCPPQQRRHSKFLSGSEDDSCSSSTFTEEEERLIFEKMATRGARPSCIALEMNMRNVNNSRKCGDSVLAQVHHDLAKYHEMGRFNAAGDGGLGDLSSALYHERHAAELGVVEAVLTMAKIHLQMARDVLVNCTVEASTENMNKGIDYMLIASDAGDRSAMIYMGKAYQSGIGLGTNSIGMPRLRSYAEAVSLFERAINTTNDDDCGEYDATMDDPTYQLQARIAELYANGGFDLQKDAQNAGDYYSEAADGAMAAMKGRLANKYYALAEEAYAEVEEE